MSHTITDYKAGISIITPEPLPGSAGQMLNDNFKAIGDQLETLDTLPTTVTGLQDALSAHASLTTAHGSDSDNTPGAIVQRDASGNFVAGTITAAAIATGSLISSGELDIVGGDVINVSTGGTSFNIVDGTLTAPSFAGDGASITNVSASHITGSFAESQVTNLVTDLALKAPIASPSLTGIPLAPTAAAGTSTTQIATTAFVTTADNLKANLASPTFSGTVTTVALNVGGDLTLSTHNLITDTTTGTKIGTATTQKLGFFNATPIVQPSNTTDLKTSLVNLGLIAGSGATPLNLNGGAITSGSITSNSFGSFTGGIVSGGVITAQTGLVSNNTLSVAGGAFNVTNSGGANTNSLDVAGQSTFNDLALFNSVAHFFSDVSINFNNLQFGDSGGSTHSIFGVDGSSSSCTTSDDQSDGTNIQIIAGNGGDNCGGDALPSGAGGNIYIAAGSGGLDNAGNGTGTSGSIYLQSATICQGTFQSIGSFLASSTSSFSNIATFNGGITMGSNLTFGANFHIVTGTTTGTKIGTATTQKIGFFNATPVVQQTGNIITALSTLGLVTSGTITEANVTNLTTDLASKLDSSSNLSGNLQGQAILSAQIFS